MWKFQYAQGTAIECYESHIRYLKRVVPEGKLLFFDVKDGWEPLCETLGKEVPDVPFPRVNDSKTTEELAQKMEVKGLQRWAVTFAGLTAGVAL